MRALKIIQKDLFSLFDFIEPSNVNLQSYSFRTHELLMRTCIEIEANFKAILSENGYAKNGNWNINDYKRVETSHFLSSYYVEIPVWREGPWTIRPFEDWTAEGRPEWYQAYNAAKHDRHTAFPKANFENLLKAVCGLVVLISSQFRNEDFSRRSSFLIIGDLGDGFEDSTAGFFWIKYPKDIPQELRYDFSWQALEKEADPFENFAF